MKLDRKIIDAEVKALQPDGSSFSGLGAVFHNVDSYGDAIQKGAFKDSLKRFREKGFIGGLNHNWDEPIGKPTTAKEVEQGLYIEGSVLDTAHGLDMRKWLANEIVSQLSIGYRVKEYMWLDDEKSVSAWWDEMGYSPSKQDKDRAKYGVFVLTKIELYEVSPVMVPANDLAQITEVKDGMKGHPFDEQVCMALAAVQHVIERGRQIDAKRREDGRTLSPKRLAKFKEMRDVVSDFIAATEQAPTGSTGSAPDLKAERLRMLAYVEGLCLDA